MKKIIHLRMQYVFELPFQKKPGFNTQGLKLRTMNLMAIFLFAPTINQVR